MNKRSKKLSEKVRVLRLGEAELTQQLPDKNRIDKTDWIMAKENTTPQNPVNPQGWFNLVD